MLNKYTEPCTQYTYSTTLELLFGDGIWMLLCLDNNNSKHFIWVRRACILAKRFMYLLLPSDSWCLAYKALIYFVLIIGYYYAQIHMGYETYWKNK